MTAKEILLIKQMTEAVDLLFSDPKWKQNIDSHFTRLGKLNNQIKHAIGIEPSARPAAAKAGKLFFGLEHLDWFNQWWYHGYKTAHGAAEMAQLARDKLGFSEKTMDIDILNSIGIELNKHHHISL